MKTKMKWLSGLTLGVASFALLGLGCLQAPVKAFADTTIGGVDVSAFTMEYGAGVRRVDDGIRFTATMDATTYTNLEALESETVSVSYGVLITTSKYANMYDLTEENVFGASAKYYWDESSKQEGQVRIINKLSPVMGRADGAEETSPVYLYGMVLDTVPNDATPAEKKAFMQGKYVARAYIQYEVTNGEKTTTEYYFASYYDGDMLNNTRSMYQTALNRIKVDDTDSANLYATYVAPVLGESYTLVTTVDGVAQSEQTVDSSWTAEDVITALSKTDYKKVSLSASKATGEIVLTVDFTSIWKKPVITVDSATVEIYSGDEYDVMDGVSVTDAQDGEAIEVIVLDDDGFDGVKVGTYTITYTATNSKGLTATATKTVTVTADVVVEVPTNAVSTWTNGTKMNFALAKYHALTENYSATYSSSNPTGLSGVYHNVSDASIVVSLTGSYGEAIILDANGMVIEGRDGANGQYVDKDHPTRVAGNTISANFAKNMTVPAGGMAIVVYQNTFGSSYDTDGRKFIRENLVKYGAIAQVYLDEETPVMYTTYVDQAPTVYGNSAIDVSAGEKTQDEIDAQVLVGLAFKDDNGTFMASDDITTGMTATITDRGGLNPATAGTYTYTLTVSDGTNVTTFTRTVNVVSSVVTVQFQGEAVNEFNPANIAVNTKVTAYNNYSLLFYTYGYSGGFGSNGYGVAMIIDTAGTIGATGSIVRIYDGANGKYIDANNLGSNGYGVVDSTKCKASTYITDAFNSLQEGEIMIVAPNNSIGGVNARQFLLNHRLNWIDKSVTITGVAL